MLRNRDKRLRQIHISFLLSGERRMNIPTDVLIPLFSAPGRQPDLRIQCLFFTGERLHAGKNPIHLLYPYSTFPLPAWPRFPSSYRSPSLPVYPSTLCRAGFCRRSGLPDPRPEYREFQRIDTISSHPYRP